MEILFKSINVNKLICYVIIPLCTSYNELSNSFDVKKNNKTHLKCLA